MKKLFFLLLMSFALIGFLSAQETTDGDGTTQGYIFAYAKSENVAETCVVNSDSFSLAVFQYGGIDETVFDFYKTDGYEKHVRVWERQYRTNNKIRGYCHLMKIELTRAV